MGMECECRASYQGENSVGKLHLDNKSLLFRGDFRFQVELGQVSDVEARKGIVTVTFAGREAALELGKAAEKWALKIRYPRSLIDKLGVKPGQRVSVIGVDSGEDAFWTPLGQRTEDIHRETAAPDSDWIFYQVECESDLARLKQLEGCLVPSGSIWVLWPKGRKHFTGNHVRGAALAQELVDVKIVSFSDRLSGLKLMIPLSRR